MSKVKDVNVVNGADLKKKVNDIELFGNPDFWRLICKASSKEQGWMKSTKAHETKTGTVIQVTTQIRNLDGTYSVAEALSFIEGACINDTFEQELSID